MKHLKAILPIKFILQSIIIVSIIGLSLVTGKLRLAIAQSPEEGWTNPVNLSQSGSTSDPSIVADTLGRIHVLWKDTFIDFAYSWNEAGNWSPPVAVDFPQAVTTPRLVAANRGNLHAIWIDENGALIYGFVKPGDINSGLTLASRQFLAESALNFDIAVDEQGVLHLVYIRPLEDAYFPAGIYYRRSENGGNSWFPPILLEASRYYRGLTTADTNISIASSVSFGVSRVYITWDNLLRKRVYSAISQDGGRTWSDPIEVDRPDVNLGQASPSGINVSATERQALLIWQTSDQGGGCTQFYSWSEDGGVTWSDKQEMLADIQGCLEDSQFIVRDDGLTILMAKLQTQVYLIAWDGDRWSNPQLQNSLSTLEDPETFNQIDLACQESAYLASLDQLSVASCDASGEGDIWSMSRLLGGVDEWFPPPRVWSEPIQVAASVGEMLSPILVSDSQGSMHAFWSQEDDITRFGSLTKIYYARYDQGRWLRPLALFEGATANPGQPAAAVDGQDNIYLVWSDRQTGEIYLSWANASQAYTSLEWTVPQTVPSLRPWARSPSIYTDGDDTLYVAYALPFNEDRGIYITSSIDRGISWSKPVLAFDAVEAGWDLVDQPRLSGTSRDNLFLLWTRYTPPGGSGSLGLYAAKSDRGGISWSTSEMVTETPVIWSQILGHDGSTVHRLWQELSFGRPVIKHQISDDNGLNWSPPNSITSFGEAQGEPGVTKDAGGQLHLVQFSLEGEDNLLLKHWLWDGTRWLANEDLEINQAEIEIKHVAAGVTRSGELGVSYSAMFTGMQDDQFQDHLYSTHRKVQALSPEVLATPSQPSDTQVLVTASATLLPTVTATQGPSAIATQMPAATENIDQTPPSADNSWGGLALGGALAGLLVVVATGYVGFRTYQNRRERGK